MPRPRSIHYLVGGAADAVCSEHATTDFFIDPILQASVQVLPTRYLFGQAVRTIGMCAIFSQVPHAALSHHALIL